MRCSKCSRVDCRCASGTSRQKGVSVHVGLTALTLDGALNAVGDQAFAGCDGLTKLVFNGGVAGVVTRGDILEEITGDIYNELSKPRPIFQSAGPYAWLVDANISLEEINRKLRLDLRAGTSDRLAGWITENLGSVPKQDDVVRAQGVRVRVMQTIRLRVTLAHLEKTDVPRGGPAA